jgi:hypothetical protein
MTKFQISINHGGHRGHGGKILLSSGFHLRVLRVLRGGIVITQTTLLVKKVRLTPALVGVCGASLIYIDFC